MGGSACPVLSTTACPSSQRGRLSADRRRHPLDHPDRIILAQHTSSLRSLVEGALLLSSMERGWAMGTHPTRFAGSGGSPLLLGLTYESSRILIPLANC